MKQDYSYSVNNWFKDFPRVFKMTCGPNITELEGPWVEDTQLDLIQTPLSKVHQGSYTIGSRLPDYQVIFTDSGSDTDFKIKYIEYGWGTFIRAVNESNYFLQIEKYCELWSGYNGKCIFFKKFETLPTTIETYHNLTGVTSPSSSPSPSPSPGTPDPETGINYNPVIDPETGLYPNPAYFVLPDQLDLSYYCPGMIEAALPWCDPPINYIEGQPAYTKFYQVGMQSQFPGLITKYMSGTGFFFLMIAGAPDKNGFYFIFWRDWAVVTGYIREGPYLIPIVVEGVHYPAILYMHSIIYGGEEVVGILRDAYFRAGGELF